MAVVASQPPFVVRPDWRCPVDPIVIGDLTRLGFVRMRTSLTPGLKISRSSASAGREPAESRFFVWNANENARVRTTVPASFQIVVSPVDPALVLKRADHIATEVGQADVPVSRFRGR